jgi:hypothetical protein
VGKPAHAGAFESYFIHLVTVTFNPAFDDLVATWDKNPKLAALDFLEPGAKKLAYIRKHQRMSPGSATATPLTGALKTVSMVLQGDQATIEKLWLDALGVGSMSVEMDDGELEIVPPKALRDLGAPAKITEKIAALSLKVNAPGGVDASLSAKLTPGPFSISLGEPSIVKSGADKGKVKVTFKVKKDSVLASGKVTVKVAGTTHQIGGDLSPRLASDFTASAFFRFDGPVLVLDRVQVGNMSLKSAVPDLGPLNAAVGGLLDLVEGEIEKLAKGMLGGDKIAEAFDAATKKSGQALLQAVQESAAGLVEVDAVTKVGITDGNMAVTVTGKKLGGPALPSGSAVEAAFAAAAKVPSKKPLVGGKLVPIKSIELAK